MKDTLSMPREASLGWYVYSLTKKQHYLHSDNVIRESIAYRGKYLGYFKTEEDAFKARNRYYGKVTIKQLEV